MLLPVSDDDATYLLPVSGFHIDSPLPHSSGPVQLLLCVGGACLNDFGVVVIGDLIGIILIRVFAKKTLVVAVGTFKK